MDKGTHKINMSRFVKHHENEEISDPRTLKVIDRIWQLNKKGNLALSVKAANGNCNTYNQITNILQES